MSSLTAISFSQTPAESTQTLQVGKTRKKRYYYFILNYSVFILANLTFKEENVTLKIKL